MESSCDVAPFTTMMESAHARQLDDTNGNNKLDDGRISPNPDFTHAVGQIVAGTAIAPYYTREDTPLKPSFLSSQACYASAKRTTRRSH
ncbi:MAG: hypothetical protein HQ515_17620 [Phycisphaeraceae bacterium]|nr:hypothetical protein [Phycisphaeraceae bacterium]